MWTWQRATLNWKVIATAIFHELRDVRSVSPIRTSSWTRQLRTNVLLWQDLSKFNNMILIIQIISTRSDEDPRTYYRFLLHNEEYQCRRSLDLSINTMQLNSYALRSEWNRRYLTRDETYDGDVAYWWSAASSFLYRRSWRKIDVIDVQDDEYRR